MTATSHKVFKTGCVQSRTQARDERLARILSSLKNGGNPMTISVISQRAKTSSEVVRKYFREHNALQHIQTTP